MSVRRFSPALATIAILGLVIGLVQVAGRALPAVREAPGFAIAPNGAEVSRLAPVTVTFAAPPAERVPARCLRRRGVAHTNWNAGRHAKAPKCFELHDGRGARRQSYFAAQLNIHFTPKRSVRHPQ